MLAGEEPTAECGEMSAGWVGPWEFGGKSWDPLISSLPDKRQTRGSDNGGPPLSSQTPRPEPGQAEAACVIGPSLPPCSILGLGPGPAAPSHPTPARSPADQAACPSSHSLVLLPRQGMPFQAP